MTVALAACNSEPGLSKSGGGDDPDNPGQKSRLVSVAYLKSLHNLSPVTVAEDIRIEGRVVSTDRQGVLYRTLCVEDATGGIALMLEGDELFKRFPYGSMVTVNCNSLRLGTYGGLLRLGEMPEDERYTVAPVAAVRIPSVVRLLADPSAEPQPARLMIPELSGRYLNCYVYFDDVQFAEGGTGALWCDTDPETDDPVDTDRLLVDRHGNTLKVRVSRHARFARQELPAGSGTAYGILGYFGSDYQLIVYDPRDMERPRF